MEATTTNQQFKVGDICYAHYAYSGAHTYYLVVTKRTPKTVSFARIESERVTDDGYGQNGTDRPLLVDGKPVISKWKEEYKNKRIKIDYDGSETAKIMEYVGMVHFWDGKKTLPYYTD